MLKLKILRFLENYENRIPFLNFLYLLKDHKSPLHLIDSTRDYFKLKKSSGFLRNNPSQNPRKKVLIVSLTNFIYQIKLESMLGKALQFSECDVYILTFRHFFWPCKYFKLFGLSKFIYFEDYLNKFKKNNFEVEIDNLLKEKLAFQEVKKWKFKGCRLGQQVLSTLARRMLGTPDLLNSKIHNLFVYFLQRQMKSICASEVLLEEVKPDILIFNEANDSYYGGIFDLAFYRGLDVIQFVQPFRDDSLIFKRFNVESKGLHPNSLSKSTFEKIKELSWSVKDEDALWEEFSFRYSGKWFLSQRNQAGKINNDESAIVRQLGLDANKKTAVVFTHVLWDANLFYGDDLFQDYEDWFVETVKAACANPRVNWIIKMHPSNIWKRNRENVKGELREVDLIRAKIGQLPKHVYLLYPQTDINTISLFKVTDYGITVRGTVGMELPCFGKPVLTAGTGRYSGLGFTIDSPTRQEYLDKLSQIQAISALTEAETLLAKKHAFAVFSLRPWPMKSFKAYFKYEKKGIHPLDHNLIPMVKSFEELARAQDLKQFSRWVLSSDSSDYLQGQDRVEKN
jgi:hypothetical protein